MKAHALHDLAALKQALQAARREAEARAAAEREQAARERREHQLFALHASARSSRCARPRRRC